MRILTVVQDLGPGGTQRMAQNGALGYKRLGHESGVLAYRAGGPRRKPLEAAGITCFDPDRDSDAGAALRRAIEWSPDAVHVHRTGHPHPPSAGVLRALREASSQRLVVVETNVFARVDRTADRELVDVHCPLTRWCLWKWQQWARGLKPAPIGVMVPYCIDAEAFRPVDAPAREAFRREHGIPLDAFVIGRIGQPSMAKWTLDTVHAFRGVAGLRADARLVLVGAPDAVLTEAARLPEDARRRVVTIDFLHGDDALRACYGSIDAFLHTAAIGESFGMVLCEAMLCGTPVVTLSTPAKDNSQIEVVGHERGGLVAADTEGLVRCLVRLAEDPGLRHRLGDGGRAWSIEQYDPDRVVRTFVRLMELVLESGSRDELRTRVNAEPGMLCSVTDAEVLSLLDRMEGRTRVSQRLLLRLVSNPLIYAQYMRLKSFRRAIGGRA